MKRQPLFLMGPGIILYLFGILQHIISIMIILSDYFFLVSVGIHIHTPVNKAKDRVKMKVYHCRSRHRTM